MDLSLGFLFCSIDLYFCLCASTILFDDCGFVVEPKVRQVDSSSSILLSRDCFGYSRFFVVPYKVLNYLFQLCEKYCWQLDMDCIESTIALGSTLIFTILILLIHEHSIQLHLLVSSLISFISVLQFSIYRSFVSLGRYIPKILFISLQW